MVGQFSITEEIINDHIFLGPMISSFFTIKVLIHITTNN